MKITNKNLSSFSPEEYFEAGIVLLGSEVKAFKLGHADLAGSYVKIMGTEAYLVNAKIFPYTNARVENYDEARTRKLLLHKKELLSLKTKLAQGKFTLIPTSMYVKNNMIKLNIALSRGKKEYEKRADIKKRDFKREAEEAIKKNS